MGNPSVVARMPEQLDVFRTAGDGRVYTSWWHGGSEWLQLARDRRLLPVRSARRSRRSHSQQSRSVRLRQRRPRLHVVVVPRGGLVRDPRQLALDRRRSSRPARRCRPSHACRINLDLFITGNDGRVYTSWWYAGADWSGINDNWRSSAASSRPARRCRPSHACRTTWICSSPATTAASTPRGGHAGTEWSGINDNWRSIGGFFPAGAPVSAVARMPDQPGSVHHWQRRPRLHLVVARGHRMVGDQRQLALDRRGLPARGAGVGRRTRAESTWICSSLATTAASTPRGGTRAPNGRGSTTTGARSAASSRPAPPSHR